MTNGSPMTDRDFAELAAIHGGDLADWPARLRENARATLAASAAARAALDEARALDAALADLREADMAAPPSAALMAGVLADAAACRPAPAAAPGPAARGSGRFAALARGVAAMGGALRPAAFAASAAAGLAMGYAAPDALGSAFVEAARQQGYEEALLSEELLPAADPAVVPGLE